MHEFIKHDHNHLKFYNKLPRNKWEFILYCFIVSVISINSIGALITMFETSFTLESWVSFLKVMPLIWLCVVCLVYITYIPVKWLTNRIVAQSDSFRAVITVNILCSVLFLSPFLTVIGTWIGTWSFSWEPFKNFFYKWPRNFGIAFGVESLLAQPIARLVMMQFHKKIDKKKTKSN
jgi:hypothetical protein